VLLADQIWFERHPHQDVRLRPYVDDEFGCSIDAWARELGFPTFGRSTFVVCWRGGDRMAVLAPPGATIKDLEQQFAGRRDD
jgi:hypothetical protein